jgi:UDP-N-acetylglucosamine 2-epimerase
MHSPLRIVLVLWYPPQLLDDDTEYGRMNQATNAYGGRPAAERIAEALMEFSCIRITPISC